MLTSRPLLEQLEGLLRELIGQLPPRSANVDNQGTSLETGAETIVVQSTNKYSAPIKIEILGASGWVFVAECPVLCVDNFDNQSEEARFRELIALVLNGSLRQSVWRLGKRVVRAKSVFQVEGRNKRYSYCVGLLWLLPNSRKTTFEFPPYA
jgi:hypothetical protein